MDNPIVVKKELLGLFPEEMAAEIKQMGLPAFRAGQVFSWLHKGATFDEMTNISKDLREKLKAQYVDQPVTVLSQKRSQIDDTCKLLFAMRDGNCVEGVLMHYHHGYTLCLSTQVGCRMGCAFCASTLEGRVRNLTAAEMMGEVLCASKMIPEDHISNLVLMGSGEPLDNYDEVMRFLRLVSHEKGLNIGLRHISLSTCGLVPRMYDLAEEKLPVTLSLSLHAPNDDIRKQLMPVAKAYKMEDVLKACRNYIDKTGRRVIFEYALVDQLNSLPEHAAELASRLRGMQCHVNVIPLNSVEENALKGCDERAINRFMQELSDRHISVTRRREMGDDIDGACGQLRRKHLKNQEDAK